MRQRRAALALVLAAGLVGGVVPLPALAAADPGCTALGGTDGAGTCNVSAAVTVTGTITVNENLHLLGGASLNVNPSPFSLIVNGNLEMDNGSTINGQQSTFGGAGKNVSVTVSGDMTMHGGSKVTTENTNFGGTAGTITIKVGNYPNTPPAGVFTMETGSIVTANGGGSGTANDIVIEAGKSAVINGQVLSQVLTGLTGTGATQGRDGASIFISTGCGLDIGGTVSSYGRDAGADLVHLQSCRVTISGFVQSSGAGHGIPNSPENHCAHDFRPDKLDSATGCVEVWADIIEITATGEIEADINDYGAGGSQGTSWIDLFAWKKIDITGRTGADDTFSVHADSYSGSDSSFNYVTAKVLNGAFSGGGKLFSASDLGNGSWGGSIVIEAHGAVTLDTGTVMAAGDNVGGGPAAGAAPCDGGSGACGTGGTIAVRSFNAALSWQNGVGDVNPDRTEANPAAPNAGSISLTACTGINITGSSFDDATPSQTSGVCGGAPQVNEDYVEFLHALWAACGKATISGTKWNDLNGNHVRDVGDVGLQGWHIIITGPGGPFDVVTDANGDWSQDVPGGSYTVCEVLQPGWSQTYPTSGTACAGATLGYTVEVVSSGCCETGVNSTGNDFGNTEDPGEWCEKLPVQTVLNPTTGQYKTNKGPDVVVRVDLGQSVQDAVDNTGDANNDGFIIIAVSAHANGSLGGSANQKVAVWKDYTEAKPFALIGCSVTLTGGGTDPAVWIKSTANAKNISVSGRTTDIFVMDLHGANSAVGVQADGSYRYLRNEYGTGSGTGIKVVGNTNTIHNGKGEGNTGDGVYVAGNSNLITDTDSFSNGGNGFKVVGASNQLLKLDAGDKGKGNTLDGVNVSGGNSNTISENGAFANGGDGIDVAGNSNALTKNVAGDKGKGNTGSGIRVVGASNTLTENKTSSNKGDGFVISGGLTSATANLLKNNLSNTSSAGSSDYENLGAEMRLTNFIKNNGGGNKIDSVALPSAAKIASFPASGATFNYAAATAGE